MIKILVIISILVMILKLSSWSEEKKCNALLKTISMHEKVPAQEAYFYPKDFNIAQKF